MGNTLSGSVKPENSEFRPETIKEIVIFSLDDLRYALPLPSVVQVVRAVEIIPLPKAPEIVLGVINVHGQIIPVINIRSRFCLPDHELRLEDRFIIIRATGRLVALAADSVEGVSSIENKCMIITGEQIPFAEYIKGVVKLDQNLFMICDLDRFLSFDEEKLLDKAFSNINEA